MSKVGFNPKIEKEGSRKKVMSDLSKTCCFLISLIGQVGAGNKAVVMRAYL